MILDLFAGPGGWDEGARMLGVTDTLGLEWDAAACATAEAAGHARVLGDLSMMSVADLIFYGLIASPPCQAWSTAGKGLGKLDKPRILAHVQRIRDAGRWLNYSREGWHDERSPLVLEPLRYALNRPGGLMWCAFEQVPAVLPLWEAFADILRDHGFGVATGVVSAERYGVPQTRKRAILLARREEGFLGRLVPSVVTLPDATHQPYRKGKAPTETHLPRWVSMAEALGWDESVSVRSNYGTSGDASNRGERAAGEPSAVVTSKAGRNAVYQSGTMPNAARRTADEPAPTVLFGHNKNNVSWLRHNSAASDRPRDPETGKRTVRNTDGTDHYLRFDTEAPSPTVSTQAGAWAWEAPATTVQGDPRAAERGHHDRQFGGESVRVSVEEAARLQSFPPGYPWQGSKTKQYEQIGNAIPPVLAAALLGHLLGLPWHHIAHSMRPDPILTEFPWLDAA